jgi:iron complex outermembrane receptor protein
MLLLAAVAWLPAPARADDPLLGTIDVTAPPAENVTSDTTAAATVVPITNQPAEGKTLADVLDDQVGVQVRRFGGLGDFSTISIRGSSPGQVGFFLDGIPLTRARSDTVNLADLPLDELQRVEIYRGTSPLAFSASALAGVVNLVTREPTDTPQVSILGGGGSFGTRKGVVTASEKHGPWSGLVTATYLGSEGNFPFHDDNGTPLNPSDDQTTDRKNNAFDAGEVLAKLRYTCSNGATLTGVQDVYLNHQGVPGIGAFQSEDASLRDIRSLTYLRLEGHPFDVANIDAGTTGYYVYEREQFRDVKGEIGVGSVATRNQTDSAGLDNSAVAHLGAHDVEGRVDVGGEIFHPVDELAPDPNGPDQSRIRFDVAVGDTFSLLDERFLVQPSFRYEHLHDDFGGTVGPGGIVDNRVQSGDIDLVTPRLGLRFDWTPQVALRGNAGRYGRAPTFSELFGNEGSVIGNPNLKPEKGVNADMGVAFTHDGIGPISHVRAEAIGFVSFVDDQIVLVQNSQRTAVPRNVASARVLGTEATLALDAYEHVHFSFNYTFQDARDESGIPARDGNHLPGRPEHSLYLRSEYHIGPAQLFYELDFLASNFLDQANFREVASRTVHTIGVTSRLPWPAFEVSLELRNLTDNQIEDIGGFPLPGRSVFGSIRWHWQGSAPQEST